MTIVVVGDPLYLVSVFPKKESFDFVFVVSVTLFRLQTSKKPLLIGAFCWLPLYQLGSWKGTKASAGSRRCPNELYQLGSWKGTKATLRATTRAAPLYQLGSWKGTKAVCTSVSIAPLLYQLGSWKGTKAARWRLSWRGDYINWGVGRAPRQSICHRRAS